MNTWVIQVLVLLSFSAHFFLVFFASRKNRTNKKWLMMLISAIYSLGNWVAPFALGLISNQQDCSRSCGPRHVVISGDLLAFWATFLLLHLGGPSNIASLSLDENDMWLKKLVELGSNVITATLVFSRATTSNLLFPASFLVLLVGIVKYAERTLTLFWGRSGRWDSIAALVENTDLSQVEENLPTDVESVFGRPIRYYDPRDMLRLSRCFYKNFKGFIVGVNYGPRMRNFTRDFFLKTDSVPGRPSHYYAIKLVEIELSIIHEDLHIKAAVTRPIIGYTIRTASLISIITAFVLFCLHDKHGISKIDIAITYVLLLASVLLEIISLVMVLLSVRGVLGLGYNLFGEIIARAMAFRRRSFPQYQIYRYLREISEEAGENVRTVKEMCSGRGNFAVREFNCENLIGWSLDGVGYANSLMRWHIATDICIRIADPTYYFAEYSRDKSAILSEYLLYLLLWKPSMIAPAAGNWQPIFRNAYAEARQFFHDKSITDPERARQALLSEVTDIDPALSGGGASESVWKDACRLAKQLNSFNDQIKWRLILQVWMELLVYAAFNSEAITHIRQLGEGGEVLTVVWLLMNHLGLGKNFSEAPAPNPA